MQRLYNHFFARLPVQPLANDGDLHILNAAEVRLIRRRHRQALLLSAGLSVAGFLAYFLPVYGAPAMFPSVPVSLPFVGAVVLPWAELLWGIVLMVLEIYLLVLLNLWGVHEIAVATGLMGPHNKSLVAAEVIGIGLGNEHRGLLRYGIDPFLGVNRGALFVFNLVLKLKGWLGTKLLSYVVQRLLGRLAVREVLDFIGMPIYMAINAYSTHVVLREARVIIMGRRLIEELTRRLPQKFAGDDPRELLHATCQFIAVSKRDFHQNHYALTKVLVERYAITVKTTPHLPEDFFQRLRAADPELRRVCVLVLVLGFILDGKVSFREDRRVAALREAGILEYTVDDVRGFARAFLSGEGIEPLLTRQLAGPRDFDTRAPEAERAGSGAGQRS